MRERNNSGRNAALLLSGIAAGILGSRILPPLIAMATGSGRAKAGSDPFALLIDDHRKILSILDRMASAPADSKFQRSRLYLALKRKLAKHALAEEDVVYPILHERPGDRDESKHLYDEHADMKIYLHELEEKLMSGEEWNSIVVPLRELVHKHADEEEQQIFPELRRQLGEMKSPKVSGNISREEAMIL